MFEILQTGGRERSFLRQIIMPNSVDVCHRHTNKRAHRQREFQTYMIDICLTL